MTLAMSAAAVAVLILASVGFLLVRTWLQVRGTRLVECPDTHQPVAVEVDVKHLLATEIGGSSEYRLRDCSRWPEKAGCGQMCLAQIEEAPEQCLVRNILGHWYEGKACALCGHAIAPVHWHDHRAALKMADDRVLEWSEVPVEQLPTLLPAARAVCWSCMIAEGFRQRHPELVIERPRAPRLHPPA
jgi:hypothetical protein